MQNSSIQSSGSFGPLFPYVDSYSAQLRERGYSEHSFYEQLCALKLFGRWLKRTGRGTRDINESIINRFLKRLRPGYPRNAAPSALRRLLILLRQKGVTPPPKATRQSRSEKIISDYVRYLLEERNLAPHSIAHLQRFAEKFMAERFAKETVKVSKLRSTDVTAYVQRHARDNGPLSARHLVRSMRSLLRYFYCKGLTGTDLSLTVPNVASWSLSTLPKHLGPGEVRCVLAHCDRSTARGRRNHAILLLLARLGLRAGEVVRLNLEDIDWENARVAICGKGQKWAQLPLPADVARAIAHYLRRDRPRCDSRRVFIRDYAPIGGFKRANAISKIVKCALEMAGIVSSRKGAHLLRHTLATDMLRKGASLEEIGEILRHKSADSTAIYAKVDLKTLRGLALPWPGGVR